ncbi:S8 family serine peptidase [Flavobacteriaceae bacterium M23B6Z8]
MHYFFFIALILNCFSCTPEFNDKSPINVGNFSDTIIQNKTPEQLKNWQLKDIQFDSVPGVSLERAYKELLKDKEGEEVIVALLDDHLDINHEDLKHQIWFNRDEIPDNGIDDDGNGYIDDVNGWNFTGNTKGMQIIYMNNEVTRVLRSLNPDFKNSLSAKHKYDSLLYLNAKEEYAKEEYAKQMKQAERDLKYANYVQNITLKSKEALSKYIPNRDFSLENLNKIPVDSNDIKLQQYITVLKEYIKYNITDDWIKKTKQDAEGALDKQLNPDYNERTAIIGDNPEDVTDIYYGNNQVGDYLDHFQHSTQVASVIAATRNNNLGIDGVSNNIKIMPVCVSTEGNEHDKDIAVGIKYAVDNGAKIINMSLGKMFSLHSEWVFDAFKYAEKHGVLIVSSAGNSNFDLDTENDYFFMDNLENGKEVSGNFLLVGSSTHKVNEQLKSSFSSYGSIDVDLFAPGDSIYVAYPNDKYIYNSGTSLASALTSGVAALVLSYYPDLSANDLKQILMQSGVAYDLKVTITGKEEEEEERLVPFSEISRTGKILNAYNAILLASKWPLNK